jgi:Protein of unknown function (DUF3617)
MTRFGATAFALVMVFALPALAAELPVRKPGLWEMETTLPNPKIPKQVIRQCVDAATDEMMQSRAQSLGSKRDCSKRDVQKSAGSITIDSTCTVAGKTRSSHVVITGSFDSGYTTTVTSQSEEAPEAKTIVITAKWIGPCAADQKPGDMIMANGMKMNIMDMQKPGAPGTRPPQQ